jgi:putative endonuclease
VNSRPTSGSHRQTTRAATGAAAEREALRFLEARGLKPLARNFRCRLGELDLVMLDDSCLVFVEVRFRAGNFVLPALSVDGRKQKKLALAAGLYLARTPRLADRPVRFDVVSVERAPDARGRIQWIKDAFRV